MEGVLAEEVGRTDVERGQTAMEMLRSSPVRLRHSHPRSLLGVVPLPLIQSLNFHQFKGDQHILGWAQAKQGGM